MNPSIKVERTPSGAVRLSRCGNKIVIDKTDVTEVARGVLRLVEGGTVAPISTTAGDLFIERLRSGAIRLSLPDVPSWPWLAMSDGNAVDAALAMLELADGE